MKRQGTIIHYLMTCQTKSNTITTWTKLVVVVSFVLLVFFLSSIVVLVLCSMGGWNTTSAMPRLLTYLWSMQGIYAKALKNIPRKFSLEIILEEFYPWHSHSFIFVILTFFCSWTKLSHALMSSAWAFMWSSQLNCFRPRAFIITRWMGSHLVWSLVALIPHAPHDPAPPPH